MYLAVCKFADYHCCRSGSEIFLHNLHIMDGNDGCVVERAWVRVCVRALLFICTEEKANEFDGFPCVCVCDLRCHRSRLYIDDIVAPQFRDQYIILFVSCLNEIQFKFVTCYFSV